MIDACEHASYWLSPTATRHRDCLVGAASRGFDVRIREIAIYSGFLPSPGAVVG